MPTKYPHVVKAEAYARKVIDGKIVACLWVRLACQRHFDDKAKVKSRSYPYKFDRSKAERVCQFAENMRHVKGEWEGQYIKLEPWQCFLLAMIFGWVKKATGYRRFIQADIMIARKNAKSTLAAIIGNYMLAADGEPGAEVYSGATNQDQANEVFRPAKTMAYRDRMFQKYFGIEVNAAAITQPETNSFFKTVIGKPGDGSSPHCAIHDEYHEHDTDDQIATMRTGMGARRQPLQLIITTAGDNVGGVCYTEFEDAKKVLLGQSDNDRLFVLIYTIDKDDDWSSDEALMKANPNLGVSVDEEFLKAERDEAFKTARKQQRFKTKHLNMWVGAMDAYFNIEMWNRAARPDMQLSDFYGREAFLIVDLASKIDIADLGILIPLENGEYAFFGKHYLPADTVRQSEKDNYRQWVASGHLIETDGSMIDFNRIEGDVLELCDLLKVQEVVFDPWNAQQMAQTLMAEGVNCIDYRNTVQNMSEPMKRVDGLIRSGKLHHNGDPVISWCIGNVVAKEDRKENVFPNKARAENKIDCAVTLIMGMGRSILSQPEEQSYTAQHGAVFV